MNTYSFQQVFEIVFWRLWNKLYIQRLFKILCYTSVTNTSSNAVFLVFNNAIKHINRQNILIHKMIWTLFLQVPITDFKNAFPKRFKNEDSVKVLVFRNKYNFVILFCTLGDWSADRWGSLRTCFCSWNTPVW